MSDAICDLLKNHPRSSDRWIGIEVERLILGASDRILHYRDSMEPLLQALQKEKKWAVDYESEGNLLGLKRNFHAISLEPGGQFEVSAAPRKTIFDVKKTADEIDAEIFSLPLARDWKFLEIGANPIENEDEIELLPSPRYRLMDSYFKTSGKRGRQMMRLTTGLQVNLDFASEAEAVSMLQAAFRVIPILSAIFPNSPYLHGKATGNLSERNGIWLDTDSKRSGFIKTVLDADFSLKKYSEVITQTPQMYQFDLEGHAIDPKGKTYLDLSDELQKLNALATMRQMFTEVRLKPCCVEIRCFDQLEDAERYSAVAMVVGLIYDDENREVLAEKMKSVNVEALSRWMEAGGVTGLKTEPLYKFALDFLQMAEAGLKRRKYGEESFLTPVENILRTTVTPAERLLRKHGEVFK